MTRRDFNLASLLGLAGAGFDSKPVPEPPAKPPATIPFIYEEPKPTRCLLKMLVRDDGSIAGTCVIRTWEEGEAARCRRCETCDAFGDACVVVVNFAVKPAEAWDFSTRGLPACPTPKD